MQAINTDGLEQALQVPMRSATTQLLLQKLKKEDSVFDYNVPPNIVRTYQDGVLMEHITNTYSQSVFVISDPQEIARYLKWGDAVMMNREYKRTITLETESDFEVKQAKPDKDGKVLIEVGNHDWLVRPDELFIHGRNGLFVGAGEAAAAFWGLSDASNLRKKHFGKYKGLVITIIDPEHDQIPNGSRGIVLATQPGSDNKGYVQVLWENRPGLLQHFSYMTSQSGRQGYKPDFGWQYSALTLLKRNYVDLDKLLDECRNENPQ